VLNRPILRILALLAIVAVLPCAAAVSGEAVYSDAAPLAMTLRVKQFRLVTL